MSNTNTALEVGAKVYDGPNLQLTKEQVLAQVQLIDEVMKSVMKEGVHYDYPYVGAPKKTLHKPGAEKLMLTFRLVGIPIVEDLSSADEIRYRIRTEVRHMVTGQLLGVGLGECSSNEEKFMWRQAVCQEEYDEWQADRKRVKWFKGNKEPYKILQVRASLADVMNNVLKRADKRSCVAACLKVTAASDMFEQDLEDIDHQENNISRDRRNGNGKAGKNGSAKGSDKNRPAGESGIVTILNVTTKSVGNQNQFTRYTINAEHVETHTKMTLATIKQAFGETAQALVGKTAEVVWNKGQYGLDLAFIDEYMIEDEPEPAAAGAATTAAPAGQTTMAM